MPEFRALSLIQNDTMKIEHAAFDFHGRCSWLEEINFDFGS